MAIRLQEIKILSEILMKQNLRHAAEKFSRYVDCDILVVYAKSKKSPYEMYEFMVSEEHFQHLAGVKHPKGAKYFYKRCLDGEIAMEDIIPVENMKTTSSKIEVLPLAIDLYSAKIYKIGEKDLGTMKCRFTVGIGNTLTIMGLDKRNRKLPVPVTVMNRKITDFCSEPCSIFLIMKKKFGEQKYRDIVYEKTTRIINKITLSSEIKAKIEI